jgi:hypothetical protein
VEQSVCTHVGLSSSHFSTFFRYMMDTALTLTTSRGPAARYSTGQVSTYQLTIRARQTCVLPQNPVGISVYWTFDTHWADALPGWNLFVAAMTPNNDLCLNRIGRVHNRASLFGNQSLGIFPLRYDSTNGSDMSGMAK